MQPRALPRPFGGPNVPSLLCIGALMAGLARDFNVLLIGSQRQDPNP